MGTYESSASCDKNAAVAEHLFASPLLRVKITYWRPRPTVRLAIYISGDQPLANVKIRMNDII
jgi:hypothetical protein